jgi:DNA (cytosine-5)-methyltransferase 1
MNYLDLFHGIGGFALGAYWAEMKFENHYCSDVEPYCQELYKLRFPDSIQLGDITKIDTSRLPAGDWIISGGFPCQDISIAGKGKGIHGKRSGLWFEYWRLIRDLRPRFAIMENVGELVRRGLREVLGSLEEIRYNAEWQDIRASDLGAPHKRERIWIIAYPASIRNRYDNIKNNKRKYCDRQKRSIMGSDVNKCDKKFDVTDTKSTGQQSRINRQEQRQFRRGNSRDFEIESDWLTLAGKICREDDGLSGNVDRLKGLGNSIVPQIAELLFLRIKELL